MWKPFSLAIAMTILTGCSTPSLIQSVSDLSSVGNQLSARSSAPYTQSSGGKPGALLSTPQTSDTTGISRMYGVQEMRFQVNDSSLRLSASMINPDAIKGIPQRYSNDCGQSAIAMALSYYGVTFDNETSMYESVAKRMSPMAWGTRIEDVVTFLNQIDGMSCTPVRQASVSYLEGLLAKGKPVPVILSIQGLTTAMHYVVVIGTGRSNGQKYILFKDPSNSDTEAVGILDEETFVSLWENEPIRSSWWSGLASFMANTNPSNYQRIAFDLGIK